MDIEQLAEETFNVVRGYFEREIAKRDTLIAEQGAALVALKAQVSSMPTPKDGRDGKDGEKGADGKDAEPFTLDLIELADQIKADPEFVAMCKGQDGADGKNGKSADPEQTEALVIRLVAKAVDAIARPRDGKDGRDGRDGESPAVELIVAKMLPLMPKPLDGKDGKNGENGRDGANGTDGRHGTDGLNGKDGISIDPTWAEEQIRSAVARLPQPKDGRDGKDGESGEKGRDGVDGKDAQVDVPSIVSAVVERVPVPKDGRDGKDGVDGKSVTLAEIEQTLIEPRAASWALDFERRAQAVLRDAVNSIPLPRDGRDGKDGEPGAGLDSFEFILEQLEDERTVEIGLRANGREQRKTMTFHVVLDRGVFRKGGQYARGDGVTYGGQFYIAQRDTQDTTPGESGDWRLAVKRGERGRDGKDSE